VQTPSNDEQLLIHCNNLQPSAKNAAINAGSMTPGQKKQEGIGDRTNSHAVIYRKKRK
jgi:hypothetical protein